MAEQQTITPFEYTATGGNGVQFTPVNVQNRASTSAALEGLQNLAIAGGKVVQQSLTNRTQEIQANTTLQESQYKQYIKDETNKLEAYVIDKKQKLSEDLLNTESSQGINDLRNQFKDDLTNTYVQDNNIKDQSLINKLSAASESTYSSLDSHYYYWKNIEDKRAINDIEVKAVGIGTADGLLSTDTNTVTTAKASFNEKVTDLEKLYKGSKNKNEITNELFSLIAQDYVAGQITNTSTLADMIKVKNNVDIIAGQLDKKITTTNNYKTLIGTIDNLIASKINHTNSALHMAAQVDNNLARVTSLSTELVQSGEFTPEMQKDFIANYKEIQAAKHKVEASVKFSTTGDFNQLTATKDQLKVVDKKVHDAFRTNDWAFINEQTVNFPDSVSKWANQYFETMVPNLLNNKIINPQTKQPYTFAEKAVHLEALLHIVNRLPSDAINDKLKMNIATANQIAKTNMPNPEQLYQNYITNSNSAFPMNTYTISKETNKIIDEIVPPSKRGEARNNMIMFMSSNMDEKSALNIIKDTYQVSEVTTSNRSNLKVNTAFLSSLGLDANNNTTPLILEGSLNRLKIYYSSPKTGTGTYANYSQSLNTIITNGRKQGLSIKESNFPGFVEIGLQNSPIFVKVPKNIFLQSIQISKQYELGQIQAKQKQSKKDTYKNMINFGF